MKMSVKSVITAAVLAMSGMGAFATTPAVANYTFFTSNNAGFASTQVGALKIEQIGADTQWTLSADWDNSFNAGSPFVFGLDFDLQPGTSLMESSLPLFDVVGQVSVKSFGSRGVFFNPANNTHRFTDGEKVSWIFHNTSLSGFVIQDLHVNAIYNGESIKFGAVAPVPEPETYAMLLAGLGLVGAIARQRKQKNLKV
jgi:hypothetical protein